MEFAEQRLAQSSRHAPNDTLDDAAQGVAVLGCLASQALLFLGCHARVRPHLHDASLDRDAQTFQCLNGDAAGDDARHGLASRCTSAPTGVTDAVFGLPGVIGVVGTVTTGDFLIVGTTGIGVTHNEADGRAERLALPDARQHLYPILLGTTAAASGLSRAAAVHEALQRVHVDVHTSGHAIEHAAHGGSVRLTEGGQCQYLAYRIHHSVFSAIRSTISAPTKATNACGSILNWRPRTPALT